MLRTEELDYHLPQELIATRPAEPRDAARLLVVSRSDDQRLEHRVVGDLPELLEPGDRLVFNTTSVIPARLEGRRARTGGRVEGLYLHDVPGGGGWVALLQGKSVRPGIEVELLDRAGAPAGVTLTVAERAAGESGAWVTRVRSERPGETSLSIMERAGSTPLPPYIRRARRAAGLAEDLGEDDSRYQTVYARRDQAGSVAAPTAGLHFTRILLDRLAARGVERSDVVLHVGVGTFQPVEAEYVERHDMHAEWCAMTPGAREAVVHTRAAGGRVVCVGTTAARTVETYAGLGAKPEDWVHTRLLVTPGYAWRWTDGLLTNFHLPRSTLLALVGALFPGGVERVKAIYAEAIAKGYRFYSFGDAMLVLP